MKKFLEEFKTFALKGNMIDLAVGMIIGAAFTGIVGSLVNDIFMPIISLVTGRMDFTNMFIALDGNEYATLEAAQEAGVSLIKYGNFITQIINFICMAFVVFMFVRKINQLRAAEEAKKKAAEEPAPVTEKECPFCHSKIHVDATRCPHCTSVLD